MSVDQLKVSPNNQVPTAQIRDSSIQPLRRKISASPQSDKNRDQQPLFTTAHRPANAMPIQDLNDPNS